jgi:hypothetical protein
MPFEISRAKIQQKLENKVSKPTLAVSGNTTGRVGYLDARDNTPLSGWLTRAVSADTSTFVSSLFYGPDPLLLTRAVLGNTGGRVRATVSSNFPFRHAQNVRFPWWSLRYSYLHLKLVKLPQRDIKWSIMMQTKYNQQLEITMQNI